MYNDNVEFKHIPGAIPELVLCNIHEEVQQQKNINRNVFIILILIFENVAGSRKVSIV